MNFQIANEFAEIFLFKNEVEASKSKPSLENTLLLCSMNQISSKFLFFPFKKLQAVSLM